MLESTAEKFFSQTEKDKLKDAIVKAELNTSGEIRIHIENVCKEDVLDRAAYIFKKLGMDKTELRNGVLFYLAVKSKKFAIIGDGGINAVVPENFWDCIKDNLAAHFSKGEFTEGICEGVNMAGLQLKKYFPLHANDVNELSDDISFCKK